MHIVVFKNNCANMHTQQYTLYITIYSHHLQSFAVKYNGHLDFLHCG